MPDMTLQGIKDSARFSLQKMSTAGRAGGAAYGQASASR